MVKGKSRQRIWEIDFLRGLCILLMVFDHAMFDFAFLPYWLDNFYLLGDTFITRASDFADYYWNSATRRAVREVVVFAFVGLSGISCSLSRSNKKRLLKLTLAALTLTLVTGVVDEIADMGVFILFGILHIIAFSLAMYILMQKLFNNKYFLLLLGVVLIAIAISFDFKSIPYYKDGTRSVDPKMFDFSLGALAKTFAGLINYGADSYGIAPYTGVFLVGAYFGKELYADKCSFTPYLDTVWHKPISFVGRNTIWVYLLHQPLVLGIIIIIAKSFGYELNF